MEKLKQRVEQLEKELVEVRKTFRSGAGEIATLPDDAPPEEVLQVLKRFAQRLLSIKPGVKKSE
jgi:hypothetical protein